MAELDDFFAKKNKKKSKPKKFVPEQMAQKLEDAEKKQQEKERRQEQKREELLREEHQRQIDGPEKKKEPVEEWQDVEEQEVDLSGLNIKDLQQQQTENASAEGGTADNSSTPVEPAGPWHKSKGKRSQNTTEEEEVGEEEPAKPPEPAPAAPASSVYVPRFKRNMVSDGSSKSLEPMRMGGGRSWRDNKVPDIANDSHFPSLGTAVEPPSKGHWSQKPGRMPVEPFRQVRGSGTGQDRISQPSRLQLGNQFDALQTNDAY